MGEVIHTYRYRVKDASGATRRALRTQLAAKIANRRRHFLHIVSHGLVQHYGEILVADVSSKTLAKTRMAKSV